MEDTSWNMKANRVCDNAPRVTNSQPNIYLLLRFQAQKKALESAFFAYAIHPKMTSILRAGVVLLGLLGVLDSSVGILLDLIGASSRANGEKSSKHNCELLHGSLLEDGLNARVI
jgi:hypothetical protein